MDFTHIINVVAEQRSIPWHKTQEGLGSVQAPCPQKKMVAQQHHQHGRSLLAPQVYGILLHITQKHLPRLEVALLVIAVRATSRHLCITGCRTLQKAATLSMQVQASTLLAVLCKTEASAFSGRRERSRPCTAITSTSQDSAKRCQLHEPTSWTKGFLPWIRESI